jgi:hypothetical protein
MGTDGACGLLFCAAKRSGTFPPNMPALRIASYFIDKFDIILISYYVDDNSSCTPW